MRVLASVSGLSSLDRDLQMWSGSAGVAPPASSIPAVFRCFASARGARLFPGHLPPGHTCKSGPYLHYPPALEEFSNVEPYWEQMFPQMMLSTRSCATAAALLHPAVSGTSWCSLQLNCGLEWQLKPDSCGRNQK